MSRHQNSTLWPLFKDITCFVLRDWTKPVSKKQFLGFKPKPVRRRVAMLQYWYDRINKDREEYLGEKFSHLFRAPVKKKAVGKAK